MSKKKRTRFNRKNQKAPQPSPKPRAIQPGPLAKDSNTEVHAKKSRTRIRVIFPAAIIFAAVGLYFVLRPPNVRIEKDSQLNVLLITLDTTRADRLGCYGYAQGQTPNLDALARSGVRFANSYAQVPLTLPSHCSIMTGTYPTSHAVHNNAYGSYALASDKLTLAKILKARGFKTAAFVASFAVDSRFGLDQGFDIYDDSFGEESPAERRAEETYAVFLDWFDKLKDEQFFCWVHFFDPHLPYNPPPSYRGQFADQPYDGEVAYMDFIIGEVMAKIKARNLLGRTLVVVAGDHGEAFGEKGEEGHGIFLYDMTLKVPLIFSSEGHLPAQQTIPARVRLIDIVPTILDMLNLAKPESAQGISLVPYIQKKTRADLDSYIETYYPKENYGWAPLFGLISGNWKYIRAPKEELYDLRADPNETKNIFPGEQKDVADIKGSLDKLMKESLVPGESGKRTLTAEEQEKLHSLGYVNYSDMTAPSEAPDPKDKLEELKTIQDAEKFQFAGDFQAAAGLYEKMLTLRPGAVSSYVNLALAQARIKRLDAAIQTLEQGNEKIPRSEILLSRLGYTYLIAGRLNEALAAMSEVLKLNPTHIDALQASAMILDNMGKREEARSFFERALSVAPNNKSLRTSYARNLGALEKFPEAIAVYGQLIQDYPRDYLPFQMLGIIYYMIKDFDKAVENLTEATRKSPTPPAYYFLALSFKEKGDTAEAARYLELYLEDPKGEPEPRIKKAETDLAYLKKLLDQ